MALLAQPKRKEKYGFDPRNTNWASDDSKFGQKLMEKMGWEKGKGLGANEDGMVDHIKASYKADTRGLGCTPKEADAWVAHQDDYNDLLRKLNEESVGEPEKANTSNKAPEEGMKRFYGRFSRGRVQTLRTTDDLDCIMGRRKKSEPSTPAIQSAANSDNEEQETANTVTSTCSVQEYFAKKMKELKSRCSVSSCLVDGKIKEMAKENVDRPAGDNNCVKNKPVYGAVSFSYDDKVSPVIDEQISRGWYDDNEWVENNGGDEKRKEKKKKKKSKKREVEEDSVDQDTISKGKKEKLEQVASCHRSQIFEIKIPPQDEHPGEIAKAEVPNVVEEGESNLKRKKSKSKRKHKESDDSCKRDEIKEEISENAKVSDGDELVEGLKTKSKKHRKVEEELVEDCSLENTTINQKKEKKRKEYTDNRNAEDSLETKAKKRKRKKDSSSAKAEENIATPSALDKGEDVGKFIDEDESQSVKKKKKKRKHKPVEEGNETTDTTSEHVCPQDTNEFGEAAENKSKNLEADEHVSDNEAQQKLPLNKKKHKVKRHVKKSIRKERKVLNDTFPGSNFGELAGYEPNSVKLAKSL